jgi:hypothetical protein
MNDLKFAVSTAFGNVVASGAIEQAIEKQLAETISSLIKTELREYSDFGKAIKDRVQQAVGVNLDRMDLPSYNDLILQIIRRQVDGIMQSEAAQQLESNMAKLLEQAPVQITLEKLIEDFVEANKEDKEGQDFTLLIERKYGSTYICLDEDAGKSEYSCDFRIAVDQDGAVYSLMLGAKDVAKTLFMGPFYGFERTLFQLYAAKSKVIVAADADASDFNTSFPYND